MNDPASATSWRHAGAIFCSLVVSTVGSTASAEEFPLVLDATSLRQAGVAVSFGSNVPPLDIKCYYYGDGGYLISTSDKFYEKFRRRGFSIEAMCLGLISETHFDPASGRRLPTYVLADRELFKDGARPSVENSSRGR